MTKTNCPAWAKRLTVDVALPELPAEIISELSAYKHTVISLVWPRISRASRIALAEWGKGL